MNDVTPVIDYFNTEGYDVDAAIEVFKASTLIVQNMQKTKKKLPSRGGGYDEPQSEVLVSPYNTQFTTHKVRAQR